MPYVLSRSYTTPSSSFIPNSSFLFRLRRLAAAASDIFFRRLIPADSTRTSSSLNNPNPNCSNRPPKETVLLDGCDFEHWLVVLENPEGDPTRDEIIDSYIKTLAMVVGSEEEARMKIYSVSTRHYFAFGALVSEELSYKIKELPRVRWVLPDSYVDFTNKDYGGEPFINGQAVPYDPKYHQEWLRTNGRPRYFNISALKSQPKGEAWMTDFRSCVAKLVELTNGKVPVGSLQSLSVSAPDYSISAALKCLNQMEDVPQESDMYLDAFEILQDAGERECFICLPPEPRRRWLQRVLHRRRPLRYSSNV